MSESTVSPPPALVDFERERAVFRAHLQSIEARGWERLDDFTFKICAGGMALSVTLLGVLREHEVGAVPLVFFAWGCWTVSLFCVLFSVWAGQRGLRSQIGHWDRGDYYQVKNPEGAVGRLTPSLNMAAMICCSIGLGFLFAFAVANLTP